MLEKAFLSVYISKFSGGQCPQTPLEARAFGARLPRRLLFQYSLLLKNLLKTLSTLDHFANIAESKSPVYLSNFQTSNKRKGDGLDQLLLPERTGSVKLVL